MAYDTTNSGAMWGNKVFLTNPKAPKWTGKINVDGIDYNISAWPGDKEKNPNAPALSLKIQKIQENPVPAVPYKGEKFADDDLPF